MASPSFHSSSIVFPSEPTPNGKLSLSEIDQMVDWVHFTTIYVYKPSPKTSFSFNSFKNALSQVLVPYYPMAGRLRWIGSGRLELDCCAAGARLIDASIDAKLDDYGDFAPSDRLRQQLVPTFDVNDPIEKIPVFMAQVTRFSCGGIVIGTAIPHTLADGASAKMFLNAWASIARGEKTKESVLQPFHNRTKLLQPQKPLLPPKFHHPEFDEAPMLLNGSDTVDEEMKEFKVGSLKVTKEQVEKLKKIANDKLIEDGVEPRKRPYSRYECITAHIWVCICKARSSGETNNGRQQTVAYIPISIESRLTTPLPEGFFGNKSMVAVTQTCEYGELMAKPLSYVAGKIREGISRFTDEYVKSAVNFLASQEEMWSVRKKWFSLGSRDEAALWENPNLYVDSWLSLSFYDLDFGWGRPCYVGPAHLEVDGESFLLPGPPDEGSTIVILRLQAKFMDEFKKLFYEIW